MITLEVSASNYRGLVRKNNEDMMLVSSRILRDKSIRTKMRLGKSDNCIFAVADGLGGYNGGEVASEVVIRNLASFFHSLPEGMTTEEFRTVFNKWIRSMHEHIVSMGKEDARLIGMGTTLVALVIYEEHIYWLNCGDSRMYRLRSNYLTQLTKDHSLESITGMKSHAHIVVNSIGAGEESYFDFFDCTDYVYDNDLFMLCSDGLTGMLSDEDIENLLVHSADSEQLVEEACHAGGTDNISVCFVHFIFN